jgi:hypothetical protein
VFATFETEEGHSRAVRYNEFIQQPDYKHYDKLLGQEIEIQEASEPTDIIWENRAFTPSQRRVKRVIVSFVILVMLAISASIIFFCTIESNKRKFRYPIVDCSEFEKQYGCNSDDFTCTAMEDWKTDSSAEWHLNREKQLHNQQTNYVGEMQCLCQFMSKADAAQGTDQLSTFTHKDDLGVNDGEDIVICDAYFSDKIYAKGLGTSISFIIIAVNIVLKTVIIKLITWIGEDTISERLASITNGVFYA